MLHRPPHPVAQRNLFAPLAYDELVTYSTNAYLTVENPIPHIGASAYILKENKTSQKEHSLIINQTMNTRISDFIRYPAAMFIDKTNTETFHSSALDHKSTSQLHHLNDGPKLLHISVLSSLDVIYNAVGSTSLVIYHKGILCRSLSL